MAIKNKLLNCSLFAGSLFWTAVAGAYEIQMNTAKMQAMDKITGRVSVIEVPVNSEVRFGSFSIVVRSCKAAPPEETPENYAFVDVADTDKDGRLFNIFKGWMTSSSPALNAIEHPIYDVWLLQCVNKHFIPKQMSDIELSERDGLPKKETGGKNSGLSKEALKAVEAEAEAKAAAEDEKNAEPQVIAPEITEVQEAPETSAVIEMENLEAIAEEGAPVSLIPTAGNTLPAKETAEVNADGEVAAPEVETEVPATEIQAVPENGTSAESAETASPALLPVLTEEDILPTVDVSDAESEPDKMGISVLSDELSSKESD